MPLIDPALVREQFDELDPDTAALLRAAMANDLRQWSRALADGWASGNDEEVRRARHTLKGLTGNFGADRLMRHAVSGGGDPADGPALLATTEATIAAILDQSR